jgi:glucose/arabinose dehydrogenase
MCLWSNAPATEAQGIKAAPRPPAQTGTPPGESATPDGYAPIPAWLGQTRAPRPIKTAEYSVETVAEGLNGAFSFNFLPDGRMLAAERAGHIRVIGKDGKLSEIEGLPSNLWARGQGSSKSGRIAPSHRTGRSTLLTRFFLTVRNPMPCRSPAVVVVSRAKLSADDKRGNRGQRAFWASRSRSLSPNS